MTREETVSLIRNMSLDELIQTAKSGQYSCPIMLTEVISRLEIVQDFLKEKGLNDE